MDVNVQIPDDIASRMTEGGADLSRRAIEALAIEEYVFARFYMYWNVYFHKTTRGFEQMLIAMWRRAKQLRAEGADVSLLPAIDEFWSSVEPTIQQYLRIEEFTVLSQIQAWTVHPDRSLSDLAKLMS